jgi:CTP:molybdopterin cytidylyltransferase MocA
MDIQAVILTGSRNRHSPLLAGTGLDSKVLLPVAGRPMLDWVLSALAGSRYAPRLWVSTDNPVIETHAVNSECPYTCLPSGQTAVGSFLSAIEHVQPAEWVVLVSGDHPLLTPQLVDTFLDQAMARQLGLAVAVVEQKTVQARYPQSRRTYFPTKSGAYSGGNLYLINTQRFHPKPDLLYQMDANRKKPWKTLPSLGWGTLIQGLLRQLTMDEIAERVSDRVGCAMGVVDIPVAECCMDVDKPSDLALAEAILYRRNETVLTGPATYALAE